MKHFLIFISFIFLVDQTWSQKMPGPPIGVQNENSRNKESGITLPPVGRVPSPYGSNMDRDNGIALPGISIPPPIQPPPIDTNSKPLVIRADQSCIDYLSKYKRTHPACI